MRIRTVKPEFWQDERLSRLPRDVRLLFIGLWNIADDYGRFPAHPAFILGQLFPYEPDADVAGWLAQLADAGRITLYEADGDHFGWVRNFERHQKIDKRAKSKLPPIPESPPIPPEKRAEPADSPRKIALDQGTGIREQGTWNGDAAPGQRVQSASSAAEVVPSQEGKGSGVVRTGGGS